MNSLKNHKSNPLAIYYVLAILCIRLCSDKNQTIHNIHYAPFGFCYERVKNTAPNLSLGGGPFSKKIIQKLSVQTDSKFIAPAGNFLITNRAIQRIKALFYLFLFDDIRRYYAAHGSQNHTRGRIRRQT